MFINSYVHPHDSPYWKTQEDVYGIEMLEQCILDLNEEYDDFLFLLNGDFNARTGSKNYSFQGEDIDIDFNDDVFQDSDSFPRKAQDTDTNPFGEQLIEFCNLFECVILNGLSQFNFDDNCTYIAPNGVSTVDYFIVSCDLFSLINFSSLDIESNTDSDHLPVVLEIELKRSVREDSGEMQQKCNSSSYDKLVWREEYESDFIGNINSRDIQDRLTIASQTLEMNVDSALDIFVKCLKDCSQCMVKSFTANKKKRSEWFDDECHRAKKESRKKLNCFRKSRKEEDRLVFVEARKNYKQL